MLGDVNGTLMGVDVSKTKGQKNEKEKKIFLKIDNFNLLRESNVQALTMKHEMWPFKVGIWDKNDKKYRENFYDIASEYKSAIVIYHFIKRRAVNDEELKPFLLASSQAKRRAIKCDEQVSGHFLNCLENLALNIDNDTILPEQVLQHIFFKTGYEVIEMVKSIVDYIPANLFTFQNTLNIYSLHYGPDASRGPYGEKLNWSWRLDSRLRKFVNDEILRAREEKKKKNSNQHQSTKSKSSTSGIPEDPELVRFYCQYQVCNVYSLLKLIRNLATHGSTLEKSEYGDLILMLGLQEPQHVKYEMLFAHFSVTFPGLFNSVFNWAANLKRFNILFKKPQHFKMQAKSYWESEYDYYTEDPNIKFSASKPDMLWAAFGTDHIYEDETIGEEIIPWCEAEKCLDDLIGNLDDTIPSDNMELADAAITNEDDMEKFFLMTDEASASAMDS